MSESSDELRQRFPKLDKLGIAILENLVEKTLGQAAIDEVKKPYAQKQIADSLGEALGRVEAEFINSYADKDARDALLQLPVYDLPDAATAIWAFYKRPNDHSFADLLRRELTRVDGLSAMQVDQAVDFYINLLNREFANVDAELRDKIQTLKTVEMAEELKAIRALLSKERAAHREAPMQTRPASPVVAGALPPGSYLPFTRNAFFTGRESDLQALEHTLLGDNPSSTLISQAIQGMGGVGKTQLAIEFAFRYGYRFQGVHWLDLRDLSALDSQIAAVGAEMLLPAWPKEQPEQVHLTLETWKREGPCLLILDNFEDPEQGRIVLSRLQSSHVRMLITSRRTDWPRTLGLHPLALEVFTTIEAIKFVRNYTGTRFSGEQLQALAEKLGCLALALDLAGRYFLNQPRIQMEEYLSKLDHALDHESMRGLGKLDTTDHDRDLLKTFSLSWQQVQGEAARKAFIVAGYCAPNTPIPEVIFEKTLVLDQAACDTALSELCGLGLLKDGPAIHPLLADYARHLDKENELLKLLAEKLGEIVASRNKEEKQAGNYKLFVPLLEHLRAVAARAENLATSAAGPLLNELGFHLQAVADFIGSRAAFERALKIDEAAYGPDHPTVAIRVNNLGRVLQDLGDLPAAKAAYERALAILKRFLPDGHPNIKIVEGNLRGVEEELTKPGG